MLTDKSDHVSEIWILYIRQILEGVGVGNLLVGKFRWLDSQCTRSRITLCLIASGQ